jgi:hypothetical protein
MQQLNKNWRRNIDKLKMTKNRQKTLQEYTFKTIFFVDRKVSIFMCSFEYYKQYMRLCVVDLSLYFLNFKKHVHLLLKWQLDEYSFSF